MNSRLVLDHPNFTTDPNPENQRWAAESVLNKRAVRIAVKVRNRDTQYFRWVDLRRGARASGAFIRSMNETGGGR